MKPYDDLTWRGKLRRLHRLARAALQHYDLPVRQVRFLTVETNTMFQVWSARRDRYVLRIYSDEKTTLVENRAERFWLEALNRVTSLRVSEPVPRRDALWSLFSARKIITNWG